MRYCIFLDFTSDYLFRRNSAGNTLEDSGVDVNSPTKILRENVLNPGTVYVFDYKLLFKLAWKTC